MATQQYAPRHAAPRLDRIVPPRVILLLAAVASALLVVSAVVR